MTPCLSKYSPLGPEEQTGDETRGCYSVICLQDHGAESDYQKLPFSDRNRWRNKEDLNRLLYSVLQLCSVSNSNLLARICLFLSSFSNMCNHIAGIVKVYSCQGWTNK